ncbi:CAP domain-containing protein [Cellulomonas persica]|uniref:SCP domain-containing protein n=1 Tax=Cellulomonas persica TaxID=76861 RepID=A0A510UZ45_9CELL|nr:CAP domain-containing protein [Cellulomonas persica]GEK18801.1 hypothetical protein CPE01_25340 [Cellulomonas persica]
MTVRRTLVLIGLAASCALVAGAVVPAAAGTPGSPAQAGTAQPPTVLGPTLAAPTSVTLDASAATALVSAAGVDTKPTKEWVTRLYNRSIAEALAVPVEWSGSVGACTAGQESRASRAATLTTVNAMRAMVQLPPVELDTEASSAAQKAALLMDANDKLSHAPSPSEFPKCWTRAAKSAAGVSNLALGASGAKAIAAYMVDPGTGNTAVGHRRWILNPTTTRIATGSTPSANALTVIGLGSSSSVAAPTWIEWPARGWFPEQLEPNGRWSLSSSDPDVSFSKATVKVQRLWSSGRVARTLKVKRYTPVVGYGPNTLVFHVKGVGDPKGTTPLRYRVTVSGITGGSSRTLSYVVRLYDPTA